MTGRSSMARQKTRKRASSPPPASSRQEDLAFLSKGGPGVLPDLAWLAGLGLELLLERFGDLNGTAPWVPGTRWSFSPHNGDLCNMPLRAAGRTYSALVSLSHRQILTIFRSPDLPLAATGRVPDEVWLCGPGPHPFEHNLYGDGTRSTHIWPGEKFGPNGVWGRPITALPPDINATLAAIGQLLAATRTLGPPRAYPPPSDERKFHARLQKKLLAVASEARRQEYPLNAIPELWLIEGLCEAMASRLKRLQASERSDPPPQMALADGIGACVRCFEELYCLPATGGFEDADRTKAASPFIRFATTYLCETRRPYEPNAIQDALYAWRRLQRRECATNGVG